MILLLLIQVVGVCSSTALVDDAVPSTIEVEVGRCDVSEWVKDEYHQCVQLDPETGPDGTHTVAEGSVCVYKPEDVIFSCSQGQWVTDSTIPEYHRHKRFLGSIGKFVGGLVSGIGSAVGGLVKGLVCIFFCSKTKIEYVTVYVTNKPPQITGCPSDIIEYAPKGQTSTMVTWSPPSATDPDPPSGQGSVVPVHHRHGPTPNTHVAEGQYAVGYVARDSGGATEYCWFTVTVKVIKCDEPLYTRYSSRTCDLRPMNMYGSLCTYTCDTGYEVAGGSPAITIECQQNQRWDGSFPTCQPVSCGAPSNVTDGSLSCPMGHVYPELCYVTCASGYRQPSGAPFTNCRHDRTWSSVQSCVDVEAPKFPNGCPQNLALNSGPLQAPTPVNWTDPLVTDNSGLPVTLTSNLAKGSPLAVGFHVNRVTATDQAGNSASCNFVVTVEAKKCLSPVTPSNGRMVCTQGFVEGSACTVTCNLGYDLQGNATLTCLNTQQWDSVEPTCKAVECPTPPQVDNGYYSCGNGYQYPFTCTLTCNPTFDLEGSANIQCQANKTWSQAARCRDKYPPVFPNGCPSNVVQYASRLGLPTTVTWLDPDVTDNSGLNVTLRSSVTSGASFNLGVTLLTYTATDVNGNHRTCQFTVTVVSLSCGAPGISQSGNSSFLLYACPNNYVHGAVCTASCSQGFPLTGSTNITCERDDSTYPPSMTWHHGPAGPSGCIETQCKNMTPPVNGALSCYQGNFAKECLMSCQADWDVPSFTDGRFTCPNMIGIWTPATVPDCLVRYLPGRVRVMADLYYFTGSCPTSMDAIKQSFIDRIQTASWASACASTPSCVAQNIQVQCGQLSGRKKREATRNRRQTTYLRFTFEFAITYEEQGSQSPEQAYSGYKTIMTDIYSALQDDARNGHFNLDPSLTTDEYNVGYPLIQADCPAGTFFKDTTSTTRFSCVGCFKGNYLADASIGCAQCPVGSYSDVDDATSCTSCSPGWSTATAASTSPDDCKEMCTPGHFSHDGFVPCQPCPPGTYQSRDRGVACDRCPAGTWTNGSASSFDECVPADSFLTNGSSITAKTVRTMSAMTLTSFIYMHNDTWATLNFDPSGGNFDPVSVQVYSFDSVPPSFPQNSSTSRSVSCPPDAWCRVDLALEPSTGTTTLYFRQSDILTVTTTPSASVPIVSLNFSATQGSAVVSGLQAVESVDARPAFNVTGCHGNLTINLLTWTPQASTMQTPTACDAVDECESSPCSPHATCLNLQDGFLCQCQDGWSGLTCHHPPSPCYNQQCQNDASCVPDSSGLGSYSCQCSAQFSGAFCQLVKEHGGWSEWTPWGNCSAICQGQQQRHRQCNNPTPANDGDACPGVDTETQQCGQASCPVSGQWGSWAPWSVCSSSCVGGDQTRYRQCDSPAPQHGGDHCDGVSVETQTCNNHTCPVDGAYGEWSDWTACNVSCGGGGLRSRGRSCDSPAPAYGGNPCSGSANETETCGQEACPECKRSSLQHSLGMLVICQTSTSPDLITCNLTCVNGFTSIRPFPQYMCGQETGYLWNGQQTSTDIVVLPACSVPSTAKSARMVQTVAMNTGCDTDARQVRSGVTQNLQQLPCVTYGCQTSITTGCGDSAVQGLGRRRRSTDRLTVILTLTMDLGNVTDINDNNTALVLQYVQALTAVDQSAQMLVQNDTATIFSVPVNGVIIQPDVTSVNYTAGLLCPSGSTGDSFYCVPCPAGSREENGQCVLCAIGQYQDEAGMTSCKHCPAGTAWDLPGADQASLCLYPFSSSNTGYSLLGDGDGDGDADVGLIVGVVLAVVAVAVIVVAGAVLFYKYKVTTYTQGSLYRRPASARSAKVYPEDEKSDNRPLTARSGWGFTLTSRPAFPSLPPIDTNN